MLQQQGQADDLRLAEFLRLAMWHPKDLAPIRAALNPEPADTAAPESAIEAAERILHLIDSGAGPSQQRLERRRAAHG